VCLRCPAGRRTGACASAPPPSRRRLVADPGPDCEQLTRASIARVKQRFGRTGSAFRSASDIRQRRAAGRDRDGRIQRRPRRSGFLYNVSTDAKVRAASLKCSTDTGNVLSDLSARPDVYAAIRAAQTSRTAHGAAQLN